MAEATSKAKVEPRPTGFSRPFWDAGRDGRFLLQRDPDSGKLQFFPRPVALWGRRRLPEWIAAKGTGTLVAVTRTTMAAPGFEDEVPYYLGLARLDEGPRVLAEVAGGAAAPKIGDRVRIVWDDAGAERRVFRFELF